MTLEHDLKRIEKNHGLLTLDSLKVFLDELKKDEAHPAIREVCLQSLTGFLDNQAEYGNHYNHLREEVERYKR